MNSVPDLDSVAVGIRIVLNCGSQNAENVPTSPAQLHIGIYVGGIPSICIFVYLKGLSSKN